jgi:ribosome recycling factor
MTKELRDKLAKSLAGPSDAAKKDIREIRTKLVNACKEAVKDLNLKKQSDLAVEKLQDEMLKKIDELLSRKQREITNL